uniref:P-type Ca(2+) transporter n=1 Tax=Junco hyemalis TaxID=40217 RepID=A0A8C5IEH9_JUNHY
MVDVSKDEKKEDDIITVDVQDTESENSNIKIHEFKWFKRKKKKRINESIINDKINKATRYNPDFAIGLSQSQVDERTKSGLTNKVKTTYAKTYWEIIKDNIFTFFNILLIIVAICLCVIGEWKNCTFLVIMIANIAIGIFQEIRSKKTIEKLRLVTTPTASVIRDGKELKVPTDNIVLDDIISLSIGNQISADSIIVDGSIEVNESLLTGESLPVKKHTGDTVYAGSFVTSGSGTAKVIKVAEANWAISLQSQAKKFQKPRSELLRSLNKIIKVISFLIVPVATCLIVIGIINSGSTDPWEMFKAGILNAAGPIIGSVPAGMFLLTSVALAVGVVNMSKKHTLVQDLYCFEMLARTNTLCLDKTGTLTDGTMEVSEVIVIDKKIDLDTVMGSYLATFRESNQTSLALAERYALNGKLAVVGKIPFSSSRKYSAVSFKGMGTFVLGAPEFVYKADNKNLVNIISERQRSGYRVLMLAHSEDYIDATGEINGEVVPVALFVLLDHVRDEAPDTIKWFVNNGVNIKIISGDNPLTASEIAGMCGVPNYNKAVSLEGLSLKETAEIADKYTVFGRVSPEQKSILVKSLKQSGKTVAMTGDGVNDILAMKQSDCSIAMASGADAAKNVAHLVLLNSNFASMPAVVLEGRRVINNIQRSSALYLMKTIFTFVLAIVFIVLGFSTMGRQRIGVPSVLLALQPDKSQIKGHFIKNTFSKAIPGAISLLIVVALTFILGQVGFFNDSSIQGMNPLEMPWFRTTQWINSLKALYTQHGDTWTYKQSAIIDWGTFINAIIAFLIIALTLFVILKTFNYLTAKRKALEEAAKTAALNYKKTEDKKDAKEAKETEAAKAEVEAQSKVEDKKAE